MCSFEEEDELHINNICSHNMYEDKKKLVSLKKTKYGIAILGNNARTKVLGKGGAKINKHTRENDGLLVQGLKKNILSLGKIFDKGNTILLILNENL